MIKRKVLIHLVVIMMALSFTSCIGIVEKVFFKKDGSGTYSMTLDMSKFASMMTMFSEGDEKNEMDEALSDMDESFDQTKAKLDNVDGVSNITQNMDKEKLIYTVSFDFRDVDALNNGLNRYFENEEDPQESTFFTAGKKSFTRTAADRLSEALGSQMGLGEDPDFDPTVLMADAYYETIIEFERKIRSISNSEYTQDGNKISLRRLMFDKDNASKKTKVTVKTK